jgi:hypothetical protein
MYDYYEEKQRAAEELIECWGIMMGLMIVGAVGYCLWRYVSPWLVIGWGGLNVAIVVGLWQSRRQK